MVGVASVLPWRSSARVYPIREWVFMKQHGRLFGAVWSCACSSLVSKKEFLVQRNLKQSILHATMGKMKVVFNNIWSNNVKDLWFWCHGEKWNDVFTGLIRNGKDLFYVIKHKTNFFLTSVGKHGTSQICPRKVIDLMCLPFALNLSYAWTALEIVWSFMEDEFARRVHVEACCHPHKH